MNTQTRYHEETYLFLVQQEVLRVVYVVVFWVLYPDPERLSSRTMDLKFAADDMLPIAFENKRCVCQKHNAPYCAVLILFFLPLT
ncbi:hypothetical protein DPMN_053045 [Dreissena polymorpha]|uniref:Uncharacterized protein n=1 Tax=Dreissena polymorpha TaxID=45954 RepID=A0A9D4HQD0_DREPO|nr:hypothetical protein DPMN_053045 [Dreissena polymorpha]